MRRINKIMSLTQNEQPITSQLLSAMKEMRDFLLDNPIATNSSDLQKYENLYTKINTLSIKTLAEGYVGYKHNNPHKTLSEFLNSGVISEQVLKYYTEPVFKKDIIKKNAVLKIVDGTIKRAGRIAGVIGKVIK